MKRYFSCCAHSLRALIYKNKTRRTYPWLFIFFAGLTLFLVSCSSTTPSSLKNDGQNCTDVTQCSLAEKLKKQDVSVYYLGDTISIRLPQDRVFTENGTVLRQSSVEVLNNLSRFLACFRKISVAIIVYVNDQQSVDIAEMRAEAIEHYLTKQNMNARLLYSAKKIDMIDAKNNYIEVLTKRLP